VATSGSILATRQSTLQKPSVVKAISHRSEYSPLPTSFLSHHYSITDERRSRYTDKKRGQPHLDDARLSLSNTDQGKSIKDAPDCLGHFTTVINSCDGNDPVNNPHNYKFGGTLTTSDGWEYKVDPLAHKENGDTCDVSYKVAYDQFEIRGKNWPDAELGANGEGLRAQISGCDGLLKWNFEWTPSDCCYQWFANGQTLAGKKTCIGHAVKTAGGSTTDNCHGAG
jgi:hypothetical protein